jgi:opacity protein-like surface antigen
VNNEYEDGYQYITMGYQAFGGAEYRINERLGFMVEGKYTNIGVKIGVVDGDITTRLTTKHLTMGFTYRQ